LLKVERDTAPEVDGVGEVSAGREENSSAAGRACRFDGAIDSRRVVGFAISGSTMLTNIKRMGAGCSTIKCALGIRMRHSGCSHKASNSGMPQKTSAIVGHLVSVKMKVFAQKGRSSEGKVSQEQVRCQSKIERLTIEE
jgi:hypothetical protein